MIITSNTGFSPTAQTMAARLVRGGDTGSAAYARGCYDSYEASGEPAGARRFQMELVSRLSQEVRATTTTGRIQELREQVRSGAYQVDAEELACRMLLQREDG